MKTLYTILLTVLTANLAMAQPTWFRSYAGKFNEEAKASAFDDDGNVYVAGSFNTDARLDGIDLMTGAVPGIFIAKYNAVGVLQWLKQGRGNNNIVEPGSLALDKNGNVYFTAVFKDSLVFGNLAIRTATQAFPHTELIVMKMNASDGNVTHHEVFGGSSDASAKNGSIKCDASGNVFVAGTFTYDITFNNGKNLSCWPGLYGELFLVKMDASGTVQWAVKPSSEINTRAGEMALDANGNPVVTGSFEKGTDFGNGFVLKTKGAKSDVKNLYVAKFNSADGAVTWVKAIQGDKSERCDIAIDAKDKVLVTTYGGNYLITDGDSIPTQGKASLIQYNSAGSKQWVQHFGSTSMNLFSLTNVAVNGAGEIYIGGVTAGTYTFGTLSKFWGGVYVAKLDDEGNATNVETLAAAVSNQFTVRTLCADQKSNNFFFGGDFTGEIDFGAIGKSNNNNTGFLDGYFVMYGDAGATGLFDHKANNVSFSMFPNPANDVLNISLNDRQHAIIRVYDIKGMLLMEKHADEPQTTLYTGSLDAGYYFVSIVTSQGTAVQKLIINR